MMTEALLAVYPDIFKAGAEFSGVPAGCWAVNYSASGQWSGPCAGGQVTHTPQQWGTIVQAMDPGYSGYRPRIQLWHGEADTTISYNNQTEAIKEWSDVLGLSTTPTSMATVTFNNHTWNHQTWQNSCGFTVLDAWSEQNGPHGTDANLNATYVIPFLGLDKTGPTDPEVAQCGDAGSNGSSSSSSGGGSTSGGSSASGSSGGAASGSSGNVDASTSSGGDGSGGTPAGSASGSNGGTPDVQFLGRWYGREQFRRRAAAFPELGVVLPPVGWTSSRGRLCNRSPCGPGRGLESATREEARGRLAG